MTVEEPEFGKLFHMRNMIFCKVSPYHLKILPTVNVMKVVKRMWEQFPYVGIPCLAGIGVYNYVEYLHEQSKRKKPGEFDCEDEPVAEKKSATLGPKEENESKDD